MDSFDSTDKVNTTAVHGMTMTKCVDVFITQNWPNFKMLFILYHLQQLIINIEKNKQPNWSFKPFSFKVIKYLHFLPLLLFVTAQNIPIPYWKTAASCWGCTLVTKSTHSEHPYYFFQDNSSIKPVFILCLTTSITICTEYSEVNVTGAQCPSKHHIFNWVAKQLE